MNRYLYAALTWLLLLSQPAFANSSFDMLHGIWIFDLRATMLSLPDVQKELAENPGIEDLFLSMAEQSELSELIDNFTITFDTIGKTVSVTSKEEKEEGAITRVEYQADGRMALYYQTLWQPDAASFSDGEKHIILRLQNDDSLLLYGDDGEPIMFKRQ